MLWGEGVIPSRYVMLWGEGIIPSRAKIAYIRFGLFFACLGMPVHIIATREGKAKSRENNKQRRYVTRPLWGGKQANKTKLDQISRHGTGHGIGAYGFIHESPIQVRTTPRELAKFQTWEVFSFKPQRNSGAYNGHLEIVVILDEHQLEIDNHQKANHDS